MPAFPSSFPNSFRFPSYTSGFAMALIKYLSAVLLASVTPVIADFGVTEGDDAYVADSGSGNGFVATISRSDGSITSIVYRGTEMLYQSQSSHIGSGLGSADVTYEIVNGRSLEPFEVRQLLMAM